MTRAENGQHMKKQNLDENPEYQLREAVKKLTREHTVTIDDPDGGNFIGSRQEKPLLLKLRVAIASNLGGSSGAGKAPQERSPLNVGAADLYTRIELEIREWYGRETDYAEHGRPVAEVVLTQWYLRYAGRYRMNLLTEASLWQQTGVMQSWIQQISDLLDPPRRFVIKSACPECGVELADLYAIDDPSHLERTRVLNAVERDNADDCYVVCRNPQCRMLWRGLAACRQLLVAIDVARFEKEKQKAEMSALIASVESMVIE